MNDPIALGAFIALVLLLIGGAYQCGFSRGLRHGFKAGAHSAQVFARLKGSEETPQHNGKERH